ncbi:hypothetical protein DV737_g3720, partial [Chaetothyriales sp. CBS 132003]
MEQHILTILSIAYAIWLAELCARHTMAPYYFVGATQAEMQAQNTYIATNIMQMPQVPTQLVPFKPGSSQQFWVKELDGSWTLREHNDVVVGELGPGHWERHAMSGYFYYVRHPI